MQSNQTSINMKESSASAPQFYFELSANGEQTPFQEVVDLPTAITTRVQLKEGENPFKYGIPSLPKGGITLKHGKASKSSKLMEWCAACANPEGDQRAQRAKVNLALKDSKGKELVNWTLFNARPVSNKTTSLGAKDRLADIELELDYSFYTLAKNRD